MAAAVPLIAASHADDGAPDFRSVVQKPLYQGASVMGSVGVAEAQVDGQGHLQLQGFADCVGHCPHDFRGPGKGGRVRQSQLDDQKLCLRRHALIHGAVPCGDSCHRRAVAAGVYAGQQLELPLSRGSRQGLIDLRGIEFHPEPVACRRTADWACCG